MKIKDLNHVALQVTDLAATFHFYGELLEFETKPRPGFRFQRGLVSSWTHP